MIEIVKALDADVYNQLTPLLDTKGGAITALPAAIGHNTLPAGPSPDNLEFLLATAVRNINRRSSETVARPGPGRTPDAALKVIRQHGATHTSAEIADMLDAAGLSTGKGKPFTAGGVARVRDAYKIFGPRTVAVQDGEVSVKQAAAELGIPADAVYNWLRHGQGPARRGPSGRWCIP
jgi:hypothetical protein